jgi:hypothetical protein
MVKTHTTTSPKYTYTLPLEGGIAVAQLCSSTKWPANIKRRLVDKKHEKNNKH